MHRHRNLTLKIVYLLPLLLGLFSSAYAQPIYAIQETKIKGLIVHGNLNQSMKFNDLEITLNVLEGISSIREVTARANGSGEFEFEIDPNPNRSYFISIQYKGAVYSAQRNHLNYDSPIEITVFESTKDISVLDIQSHSIIVTGAVPEEGFLEILERVSVINSSNETFIADQSEGSVGMPNFLRFALPKEAYNLDVRSNLIGGQVLEVDRGFALTNPVPPTLNAPHQIEFVYRVKYAEPTLSLSRTLRFGANSFRLVVPTNVGVPKSVQLNDLGATELNGRLLRLLEATEIKPDTVLEVHLSELPVPSALNQLIKSVDSLYVLYLAPAILALFLIYFLILAVFRKPIRILISPDVAIEEQIEELKQVHVSGYISKRKYENQVKQIRLQYTEDQINQQLEILRNNSL
ncbi:MAG: hypothetical protein CL763_02345 [Chloroflexi bacterium]|nr:hypothetical protein [Chloroflexota bacterium]|tara:strand:+ start:8185 stop:9402 length:1218 start_codon:yes stop_codon:yes gene_type:complete